MYKTPLYASLDIEADGDNPLQHNMLSIGIALFNSHGHIVSTFYQNVKPQQGKVADPKCMSNFWLKHPKLYTEVCINQLDPHIAMNAIDSWLKLFTPFHHITWVASPACFDWMFFKCYFQAYGPPNKTELGFSCQCLISLARGYARMHRTNVSTIMQRLGGKRLHEEIHHALSDAIYQGHCYMKLRQAMKAMTT